MKVRVKILFKNGVSKNYMLECEENETIESYRYVVETCILNGTSGSLELVDPIDNMNTIINISEIVTFAYSIEDLKSKYYEK